MYYDSFNQQITAKHGVVVDNWPITAFHSPSNMSFIEAEMVLASLENNTTRFRSLPEKEWAVWKQQYFAADCGSDQDTLNAEIVARDEEDEADPVRILGRPPRPGSTESSTQSSSTTPSDIDTTAPRHSTPTPENNESSDTLSTGQKRVAEGESAATLQKRPRSAPLAVNFINSVKPTNGATFQAPKARKTRSDKGKKRAKAGAAPAATSGMPTAAAAVPAASANSAPTVPAASANRAPAVSAASVNSAPAVPAASANSALAVPAASANSASAVLATPANNAPAAAAVAAKPTRTKPQPIPRPQKISPPAGEPLQSSCGLPDDSQVGPQVPDHRDLVRGSAAIPIPVGDGAASVVDSIDTTLGPAPSSMVPGGASTQVGSATQGLLSAPSPASLAADFSYMSAHPLFDPDFPLVPPSMHGVDSASDSAVYSPQPTTAFSFEPSSMFLFDAEPTFHFTPRWYEPMLPLDPSASPPQPFQLS